MRKVLWVVGIGAAVIVAVVVAAVLLVDVNRYRSVVQTQLEGQLGRNVTLGTMSLALVPLRLQVLDSTIAEDPAFGVERPFVHAEKLDVRVSLSSLLRGDVTVQALDLERPAVELIRNDLGIWNFSSLGGAPGREGAGTGAERRALSIERLTIRDGLVAVTDLQRPMPRTIYDHIDLAARLTNQAGELATAGNLKLNAARFNGIDVGYPVAVDFDVVSKPSEEILTINSATVQLGRTAVSVAGSVDTSTTPSRLDLAIQTGDVTIDDLARLASAFGIAFRPDTTVSGRIHADVKATGPTSKPELNGTIAARDLKISGKGAPQPIEVKAIDLALSPEAIRSNNFTATSGKTNVEARFAVLQYASQARSIDAAMRAPGATLPEIQSIARAYGMTGLDQITGEGELDLDLRASGPVESFNSESLIRAFNGTLNLDFNAIRISGFDATHELGVIGGFLNRNSGAQSFTDILRLSGHIAVKNGIAQTNDLVAETALGTLAATGTADLSSETLNLKLLAVLSKGSTEKAGGARVAGYLRTALSNSEGELVIPATISGTFKQPKFAPDVQAFMQLQKQRLIPNYQPGQKPGETLRGILGGLLGGKK